MSARAADFRDRYGPWALVCGASDGIGEAFARELAAAGLHVALLARRRDRLEALAAELTAQHGVDARVVVADLTADTLVADVTSQVGPREIGSLVYVSGSPTEHVDFLDAEPDTWTRQIRLNCDGPMQLAHAFGRGMRERRRGGLLFLTSLANQAGGGRHALYCGTKAFDQLFAESLWHELSPHGVDVLSLLVGPTHTPTTDEVLGLDFGRLFPDPSFVARADEVAREGLDHLHEGPVWIPNAALRQAFPHLSPEQRAAAVEAATASNARLDGITDYVPVWDPERGRKRVR